MVATATNPDLSYQLKITLLDTKPPVWRRVVVPGEITLDRLHDVIQIVMGWDDYHLHLFKIDGQSYSESPEEEFEGKKEWTYRLCDLVKTAPSSFGYEYDFGDNWHHRVDVEQISKVPEGYKAVTKCLEGKRHCPPEDVGGTSGYAGFLQVIKDPKHPEHKQLLKWAGGSFDPKQFDVDAVNLELLKYARWSRPRANELQLDADVD